MSQAGRAYTPGTCITTSAISAIASRFEQRQHYAAARDACPVEDDESVIDAICGRLSAIDRDILSLPPLNLADLAAQAAVVLDADGEFITEDVRTVLSRVLALSKVLS
ncbi:hypothetical protein [Phreatobacter oligotrophus]|jgi:hypothetical protein|uniref:Uncharacterized protein n=1 Tax=Phreatobacter oligotrophus TaxID=1122261 RepID=A0A2T4ZIW7_9HYPH|nr:hypothetical protein [Phreatobacter oligotrophus]PTM61925.1 hypothetical protein C8P69_101598 [Phreatobacter oligotrophus]